MDALDFQTVPRGKVLFAACVVKRGFKVLDKIAALVGQPALQSGVQNRTRNTRLQAFVGARACLSMPAFCR